MWLLDNSTREKMQGAAVPTAAEQNVYAAGYHDNSESSSRLLSLSGDSASIAISGVLTKTPDMFAKWFGGGNVTYGDIVDALSIAEANDAVKKIELVIDSCGGHVDGLFDAIGALQAATKPLSTTVSNCCASAAYAIASQTSRITAKNHAARIGSIGIAATFRNNPESISMRSTGAPKKNPDASTVDGAGVIQSEMDALHEIFVEAIAAGRGVSVETVSSDYGQGGTMLAREAKSAGLIDEVLLGITKTQTTETNIAGVTAMDLSELKLQHPAVYAAAVQIGADEERQRVSAHLTMAAAYGATDVAFKAIKDGAGLDVSIQAEYFSAGSNRADLSAMAQDNPNIDAGTSTGAPGNDEQAADKLASANILRIAAEQSGVELEARHYE